MNNCIRSSRSESLPNMSFHQSTMKSCLDWSIRVTANAHAGCCLAEVYYGAATISTVALHLGCQAFVGKAGKLGV